MTADEPSAVGLATHRLPEGTWRELHLSHPTTRLPVALDNCGIVIPGKGGVKRPDKPGEAYLGATRA